MICRIYEFVNDNNLNVSVPSKSKDCEICKDAECKICQNLDYSLSDESYGWTISRRLTLPDKFKISCFKNSVIAIKLIHPTFSTVWIAKNIEDDITSYIVKVGRSKKKLDSIQELNYYLKKECKYDARNIKIEDF